jgi:molecular chaperone DnaK (HSP70)
MSQKKVVVGIDIGAESTKVVLGSNFGCEIVRNEVGGHSTPSAISFSGKIRQIGQTANVKSKNSVIQVNRLLAGEMEDDDKFQEFYQFEFDGGLVSNLEYDGSIRSFEASAVVAMVLGNIQTSVKATMKRILSDESESVEYEYAISVGPDMQDPAKADLLDAAYAAGMDKARLVKSSLSYAYCYQRKFPEHLAAGSGNSILIIDMGKTQTSAVVVGAPPAPEGAGEEKKKRTGASSVDI